MSERGSLRMMERRRTRRRMRHGCGMGCWDYYLARGIKVPLDVSNAVVAKSVCPRVVDNIPTTNTIDILGIDKVPEGINNSFPFFFHDSILSGNQSFKGHQRRARCEV